MVLRCFLTVILKGTEGIQPCPKLLFVDWKTETSETIWVQSYLAFQSIPANGVCVVSCGKEVVTEASHGKRVSVLNVTPQVKGTAVSLPQECIAATMESRIRLDPKLTKNSFKFLKILH